MSVIGVSIGDVCLVLKAAIKLWKNVQDASEELDQAVKEMERMEGITEIFKKEIGN